MALYRRTPGGPIWTRFKVGGVAVRKSTGTRDPQSAEEFETALRARYWRQAYLGENVHLWRDAVSRYKREAAWRPSTRTRNEYALKFFERINQIAVAAINADVARAARDYVERTQRPSAANRIMAVFRGVLHACVRWGWITHAPPVPMVHVLEREVVSLTPQQCGDILLQLPKHLRGPFLFAVLTGWRMANVRDLTWSRVDLEARHAWVPSSHYKTKRAHGTPLSPQAIAVLLEQPRIEGVDHVFTYEGAPIRGTFNTKAFRKALKRAGVTARWHDLRHTFASWLAASGASDRVLMAMGGWTSSRMPARYAHLRSDELRPWANILGTFGDTALQITAAAPAEKPEQNQGGKVVPERGFEPPTRALRKKKATP